MIVSVSEQVMEESAAEPAVARLVCLALDLPGHRVKCAAFAWLFTDTTKLDDIY